MKSGHIIILTIIAILIIAIFTLIIVKYIKNKEQFANSSYTIKHSISPSSFSPASTPNGFSIIDSSVNTSKTVLASTPSSHMSSPSPSNGYSYSPSQDILEEFNIKIIQSPGNDFYTSVDSSKIATYKLGCTDPTSLTYDQSATDLDKNQCAYYKCLDTNATNYASTHGPKDQNDPKLCTYPPKQLTINASDASLFNNNYDGILFNMTAVWNKNMDPILLSYNGRQDAQGNFQTGELHINNNYTRTVFRIPGIQLTQCNVNDCNSLLQQWVNLGWAYTSSDFDQCNKCPVLHYPNLQSASTNTDSPYNIPSDSILNRICTTDSVQTSTDNCGGMTAGHPERICLEGFNWTGNPKDSPVIGYIRHAGYVMWLEPILNKNGSHAYDFCYELVPVPSSMTDGTNLKGKNVYGLYNHFGGGCWVGCDIINNGDARVKIYNVNNVSGTPCWFIIDRDLPSLIISNRGLTPPDIAAS